MAQRWHRGGEGDRCVVVVEVIEVMKLTELKGYRK